MGVVTIKNGGVGKPFQAQGETSGPALTATGRGGQGKFWLQGWQWRACRGAAELSRRGRSAGAGTSGEEGPIPLAPAAEQPPAATVSQLENMQTRKKQGRRHNVDP